MKWPVRFRKKQNLDLLRNTSHPSHKKRDQKNKKLNKKMLKKRMAKCKTKTFSTTIGYDYFHQCTYPFWKDIYKNAQKQKKLSTKNQQKRDKKKIAQGCQKQKNCYKKTHEKMTIKNEKYLPRLKKNCQKKRKIQTEKNTSHKKK